jgi:hypothetical protein
VVGAAAGWGGVRATSFGRPQLRHPYSACHAADEHDTASGGRTHWAASSVWGRRGVTLLSNASTRASAGVPVGLLASSNLHCIRTGHRVSRLRIDTRGPTLVHFCEGLHDRHVHRLSRLLT